MGIEMLTSLAHQLLNSLVPRWFSEASQRAPETWLCREMRLFLWRHVGQFMFSMYPFTWRGIDSRTVNEESSFHVGWFWINYIQGRSMIASDSRNIKKNFIESKFLYFLLTSMHIYILQYSENLEKKVSS